MTLAEQLNALDTLEQQSPAMKLRAALALYDEGVALQRLAFARRHRDLDALALEGLVAAWLRRDDEK